MNLIDAQIDRLVGPTHHFGGLGVGNIASEAHRGQDSDPASAAIQGLDKMRLVAEQGCPQLVLPPQVRPDMGFLRSLGFSGSNADVLRRAADESPHLLSAAMSCSAMWTANAATVIPAMDSPIERPALTVANLTASIHRSIEPEQTMRDLRYLLQPVCEIRSPLSNAAALRDEGAANHMRLCKQDGTGGLHVFVYGDGSPMPQAYWPRQTRESVESIARSHQLSDGNYFFIKQHPEAIDAGAFHNDVVAMSHHDLLVHHELAFTAESDETLGSLQERFQDLNHVPLNVVSLLENELSLADAVSTYLFNSQILSSDIEGERRRVLVCPIEVKRHKKAEAIVRGWCEAGLFDAVSFVDLGQSMNGGGGPACLRLRVPLTKDQLSRLPRAGFWTESLDTKLRGLIASRYSTRVTQTDLSRIDFCEHALETRAQIAALLGNEGLSESH